MVPLLLLSVVLMVFQGCSLLVIDHGSQYAAPYRHHYSSHHPSHYPRYNYYRHY